MNIANNRDTYSHGLQSRYSLLTAGTTVENGPLEATYLTDGHADAVSFELFKNVAFDARFATHFDIALLATASHFDRRRRCCAIDTPRR